MMCHKIFYYLNKTDLTNVEVKRQEIIQGHSFNNGLLGKVL